MKKCDKESTWQRTKFKTILVKLLGYSVIIKGTSGFTSNTLLFRFSVMLQYIYCNLRICKVHKRNNKGRSILVNRNSNKQRGSIMCRYFNSNELIHDQMKCLYNNNRQLETSKFIHFIRARAFTTIIIFIVNKAVIIILKSTIRTYEK